jgi:hypothetical protein
MNLRLNFKAVKFNIWLAQEGRVCLNNQHFTNLRLNFQAVQKKMNRWLAQAGKVCLNSHYRGGFRLAVNTLLLQLLKCGGIHMLNLHR